MSNDEIVEAVAVMSARKEGKRVQGSPELQKKVAAEMPAMMGEISGGAVEVAVRVGEQVGLEIEKEHPEYVRRKAANAGVQ